MAVLVVDDHTPSRTHIARFLAAKGYNVIEAGNSEEALACFQTHSIDLVLLDIMMPGMDGRQTATLMKAISPEVHTPIIFVTALNSDEVHKSAIAAGGDDFVIKPVSHDILEAKIRAHLRIRELNSQLAEKNRDLAAHNRRLVREHDLVRHFFDHALSQSYLDSSYIRYHVSAVSAFNGDVFLAERSPRGHVYVLLGDFTGHGLSAAMGTLPVAQAFFGTVRAGYVVGDVAREINRQLTALLPVDMFLAATLIEIYPGRNRIAVWSGGMPDAYLVRGGSAIPIPSRHMPLGILEEGEFDPHVGFYNTDPGDKLFLYTDGVIEARTDSDGEFGDGRLIQALETGDENLVQAVTAALLRHLGGNSQTDDLSLVEILCDGIPDTIDAIQIDNSDAPPLLPFSFEATLDCDAIRDADPLSQIIRAITQHPRVNAKRDMVYSVLAELFNNAVDYGLLDMSGIDKSANADFSAFYHERMARLASSHDGWVRVRIQTVPDPTIPKIQINVEQSRGGFASDRASFDSEDKLSGRGLMIVNSLCSSLRFEDGGRRAVATLML